MISGICIIVPDIISTMYFINFCYQWVYIFQVQVKLRPTASRSVSLGVEPPSGQMTRFKIFLVTITLFLLHVGCPL
jgi:hypothetical protein